jgi:hypothetical protein
MNRFVYALVFSVLCTPVFAQANKKTGKWNSVSNPGDARYIEAATDAIREVMEQNFQAHTAEDLKTLMSTMTSNCPDRENFVQECQQMFDDTDVYIRLVDCRWITSWRDTKGLWAAVQITQWTMPKDEDVDYTEYRHRSGLLPRWELCEYQLYARVEKGQWKAHVINGPPSEAMWPNGKAPAREQAVVRPAKSSSPAKRKAAPPEEDCPDGNCQWPNTPNLARPRMTTMK